jgi:hypothetical protein
LRRSRRRATSVPTPIVRATLAAMNRKVLTTTDRNSGSAMSAWKFWSPTHVAPPLMSCFSPKCWRLVWMTR